MGTVYLRATTAPDATYQNLSPNALTHAQMDNNLTLFARRDTANSLNGDLAVTGAITATNYISSGAGASGEKQLKLHNSARLVYYYLNDAGTAGLWDSTGSINRWYTDNSGNFTAYANVTAYSDIRLKTDIEKIPNALAKVKQISGYTFTRTDTGSRQTGLIAQEVQKVLPEAVLEGEHLSLAYGNMVGLLVEAIKEQQSEIDELKALVKSLIDK